MFVTVIKQFDRTLLWSPRDLGIFCRQRHSCQYRALPTRSPPTSRPEAFGTMQDDPIQLQEQSWGPAVSVHVRVHARVHRIGFRVARFLPWRLGCCLQLSSHPRQESPAPSKSILDALDACKEGAVAAFLRLQSSRAWFCHLESKS